jgi:hypothetical protein
MEMEVKERRCAYRFRYRYRECVREEERRDRVYGGMYAYTQLDRKERKGTREREVGIRLHERRRSVPSVQTMHA